MAEPPRLSELLARSGIAHRLLPGPGPGPPADPAITGVCEDSREVAPGALFCCLAGERHDGHDHAGAAAAAAAAALVVQRPLEVSLPQVLVGNTRAALGPLALALAGSPQRHLQLVGVTGTNGKTTVSHLLGSILRAAGRPCAVVGTLDGGLTTPGATSLAGILAGARGEGARAAVLEVTSHALVQERVAGLRFAAGVFTNLSPDHLDYHGDMESYFAAKRLLFEDGRSQSAVVCTDTPWGERLAGDLARDLPGEVHTCSQGDALVLAATARRTRFAWAGREIALPLGGAVNVANAVIAASTARALAVDPDVIVAGLECSAALPGRFEVVSEAPVWVIVDFAHSPAALEQLLCAGRGLAPAQARLTVVFGCGGDRDHAKRGAMGAIASRLADRVVITSDNPRHEAPDHIAAQIMAGAAPAGPGEVVAGTGRAEVEMEPDRRRAIAAALAGAAPGDVVIVAGKGHETTQIIGDETVPFDDRRVVRELLGAGPGVGA